MKIQLFIALLAGVGCWGCTEECGVTSEPTLSLQFTWLASKPVFTKIRAIGSTKDIPSVGVESSNTMIYADMYLPLNLNESHTTYIFEQLGRIDTLTVFYATTVRNFRRCGHLLDIVKPTSGRTISTTFKRVEVQYDSYYYGNNGSGGGLNVQIVEL